MRRQIFRIAAAAVAGSAIAVAVLLAGPVPAHAQDNVTADHEIDGKWFTKDEIPTFHVAEDGTVDWYTFSGFRRYHSECHVCHGPDGEGSTYAPALKDSAIRMDYYDFVDVVVNGRQAVDAAHQQVMPAFGENANVMCYLDDIIIYLKARGVGAIRPGLTVARDALSGYVWADVHARVPIPGPTRVGAGVGADLAAGLRFWKPRYRGLDLVPLLEVGAWAAAPDVHRGARVPDTGETWLNAGPSLLLFLDRFEASDKNKDGFLTEDELENAFQHPNNMVGGGNTIQAVKAGGTGDVTKTHVLWNLTISAPSNLSSPLLSNGRLLVVKHGGLSTCVDAKSGKVLWERERIRNFGEYYASPVAGDGKIYVAGRNGVIVVLADEPKLRVLARNDMGGEIQATPALVDGRIYIRTRQKVYCIGE